MSSSCWSGECTSQIDIFVFVRDCNYMYNALVCACPYEKINQCLTNINRRLTNIFNISLILNSDIKTDIQFYKVSVISVKYRLSIGLYRLYRLNIGLLSLLSSLFISTLVIFLPIFNRY